MVVVAVGTALRDPSAQANNRAPIDPIDPAAGIDNIDHVIFIVQENRSFDHYFGTFPGADGIPTDAQGRFTVCMPDPESSRCRRPFHDTDTFDAGGPHNLKASKVSVDHGKMDGYVRSLVEGGNACRAHPNKTNCRKSDPGPYGTPDVMGYHTAQEIPNYWAYAKSYLLQDHMFAPSDSWTLPAHLYLVSAWSAICKDPTDGMSCRSNVRKPVEWWTLAKGEPPPYAWADITWLLGQNGVSWGYYVGPQSCLHWPCDPQKNPSETIPLQNPLPAFATVHANDQVDHVQPQANFFEAAKTGELPAVSWVMPAYSKSEHPPQNIGNGQAWTTSVVNAVMQGPYDQWLHTAIFITWDDWGGFYDHVHPIRIDGNGYGLRVPGIMISPFAEGGVDHQTLSFDAYLKLIEDRFLGGQRLDPKTDGWPDARPSVRERAKRLGDLAEEFDWTQDPIPPLILDPRP